MQDDVDEAQPYRRRVKNAAERVKNAVVGMVQRAVSGEKPALMVLQFVGVLIVVDGIADWSVPAAKVVLGLVVAGAAEMWTRGDPDERA